MIEKEYKTQDVYGVGRDLPLNYVTRSKVDDVLVENLTREKHIVVYGSSKQCKTSLRKHWLKDDEHIVVSCVNNMSLSELHAAILKRAGYKLELSSTRTISGAYKVNVEFRGKGKVPLLFEAGASGTVASEKRDDEAETHKRLELELSDVNDIIAALKEINLTSS